MAKVDVDAALLDDLPQGVGVLLHAEQHAQRGVKHDLRVLPFAVLQRAPLPSIFGSTLASLSHNGTN